VTVARPIVGTPEKYRGRVLSVRLMGPDYLSYVDEIELSGFFISPGAAASAGQKYVNDEIEAKEKAKGKK
jgi:hypothetical protein